MIATLEAQAGQDPRKKAYCNTELSGTKTIEKTTEMEMLTSRVIQTSAKSAKSKAEVSTLQMSLLRGWLSGKMDQLRRLEAETYAKSKAEQERPRGQQVG